MGKSLHKTVMSTGHRKCIVNAERTIVNDRMETVNKYLPRQKDFDGRGALSRRPPTYDIL